PLVDAMYQDGFLCPLSGMVMGETAERLVEQYGITRAEQDAFALRSQQRAGRAAAEGRFEAEIVAVEVPGEEGAEVVKRDDHRGREPTLATLAKLPPVFKPEGGTVTAGNSSGITDGASALVLMSAQRAAERGVKAMARIAGVASAGVDPRVMGIGVVPAV